MGFSPMPENEKTPLDGVNLEGEATPISSVEIAEQWGGRMPPITEGQSKGPEIPAPLATPEVQTVIRDSRGTLFDPLKHAHENGTPKKNKHGNFYSAGLGKHGKTKLPGSAPLMTEKAKPATGDAAAERGNPSFADTPSAPMHSTTTPPDEFEVMAELVLQTAYGPAMALFSSDVRPDESEHAALKQAWATYFRVKGISDVSPGWGATLTTAAVFFRKTEKPTVRERIAFYAQKLKGAFKKATKTETP